MANHLNSDQQLDQAVKEALESYEVPFESSAWTEMEKSLDATPKSYHPFKKWSFSLNTIIGITALAGGLLIFKYSTSEAETNPPSTVEVQAPAPQKKQEAIQPKPEPVVAAETTQEPAPVVETTAVTSPVTTQPITKQPSYPSAALTTQAKKKKDTTAGTGEIKATDNTEIDFMKMTESHNTTPAFGDQIDPVKGFIHSTHESEKMKKLAESKLFGDHSTTVKPDTTFSGARKTKEDNTDPESEQDKKKKKERRRKESTKESVPEGTTTDAGTPE